MDYLGVASTSLPVASMIGIVAEVMVPERIRVRARVSSNQRWTGGCLVYGAYWADGIDWNVKQTKGAGAASKGAMSCGQATQSRAARQLAPPRDRASWGRRCVSRVEYRVWPLFFRRGKRNLFLRLWHARGSVWAAYQSTDLVYRVRYGSACPLTHPVYPRTRSVDVRRGSKSARAQTAPDVR